MKVGMLKTLLKDIDNEVDVFVKVSNGIGNISEIETCKTDSYQFFGTNIPCILLGLESECKGDCGNCKLPCVHHPDFKGYSY